MAARPQPIQEAQHGMIFTHVARRIRTINPTNIIRFVEEELINQLLRSAPIPPGIYMHGITLTMTNSNIFAACKGCKVFIARRRIHMDSSGA